MAYLAKLKLGGKEYTLTNVQYHFRQGIDTHGKPNTAVFGGQIQIVVQSTDDTAFAEWMVDHSKSQDGKVIFYDADGNKEIKTVEFTKGYCISYAEVFDSGGAREHLTISSKKVKIGNAEHENEGH